MAVIVDLNSSQMWANPPRALPVWLDAEWLQANDAHIICALDMPEHVTHMRSLVADTLRLTCYPKPGLLHKHLNSQECGRLRELFANALGASHCLDVSTESESEPEPFPLQSIQKEIGTEGRKSLALVSPLPPSPTGIAIYCDELLPSLSALYDITLVIEKPEEIDHSLRDLYPVINHAQLLSNGHQYDRILYHFGNSPFHYEYFTLLKAHPGVVVLHDIYLGDCIYSNYQTMLQTELRQRIYRSHGWSALLDCETTPIQSVGIYPASADVLTDALGVIVHNHQAVKGLSLYFDQSSLKNLRTTTLARKVKDLPEKASSREALDIDASAIVYSSFGMFNRNKCFDELMAAWTASGLASDSQVKLVFAGGCADEELEARVRKWRTALPFPQQVILTGYISNEDYDRYLAATDVAIQLRRNSRGESSAALLDCMGAGLPTIVNRHGSMSEMPEETVLFIPDNFSVERLAETLCEARDNVSERETVSQKARRYVLEHHAPEQVAQAYSDIIEQEYSASVVRKTDDLRNDIFAPRLQAMSAETCWNLLEQFDDVARCAGALSRPFPGQQVLVDVSPFLEQVLTLPAFCHSLVNALMESSGITQRVEPVYFDKSANTFCYARAFATAQLKISPLELLDDPVEVTAGDAIFIFEGASSCRQGSPEYSQLQVWRGRNVEIMPVLHGAEHDTGAEDAAEQSLQNVLSLCSKLVCSTQSLAERVSLHLEDSVPMRIGYFPENSEAGRDQQAWAQWKWGAEQLLKFAAL